MKKAFTNTKLSAPSKLVRRVLLRSPTSPTIPHGDVKYIQTPKNFEGLEDNVNVETELSNLKQQVSTLQLAVNSMQEEIEKKEQSFANLAREKQKMYIDLRKERRSTTILKQQLEEERDFYYKEKEQYCQEMNECKKLKKKISESANTKIPTEEVVKHKNELLKIKQALTQTLEANYNLSIKFLRMKNTKSYLKSKFNKLQDEHTKATTDLEKKMLIINEELNEIINKKLLTPIPPSSKKYLQIIKQNGILMHENLRLQVEVDKLSAENETMKFQQARTKTNSQLKYINSKTKQTPSKCVSAPSDNANKVVEVKKCIPAKQKPNKKAKEKCKKEHPATCTENTTKMFELAQPTEITTKIFEKFKTPGVPLITILSESKTLVEPLPALPKKLQESNVILEPLEDDKMTELMQVSENPSEVSTSISKRIQFRTQSAPDILKPSFSNDKCSSCTQTSVYGSII